MVGSMTDEERAFWHYVIRPADQDACWIWHGPTTATGHGRFKFDNGRWLAHRRSYEYKFGQLAPNVVLHHRCATPACVNPKHLTPMVVEDHISLHHTKEFCKRDHPLSGDNLYIDPKGKRVCRECARLNMRRWRENVKG